MLRDDFALSGESDTVMGGRGRVGLRLLLLKHLREVSKLNFTIFVYKYVG